MRYRIVRGDRLMLCDSNHDSHTLHEHPFISKATCSSVANFIGAVRTLYHGSFACFRRCFISDNSNAVNSEASFLQQPR